MCTLPTSRRFVTELLKSLPARAENAAGDDNANPLSAVDDATKKQLLSLQVLFPNEYLPALDLLDRRLITRFTIDDTADIEKQSPTTATAQSHDNVTTTENTTTTTADTPMPDGPPSPIPSPTHHPTNTIFYVRSAQQRSSRYSTSYDTTQSYEVRLLAWNCSCPAFAFAAYPNVDPDTQHDDAEGQVDSFGGVSLGSGMPPVCKHLLACVLVERCRGLFGGYVEERVVGVAEAAGWAAGWGDS